MYLLKGHAKNLKMKSIWKKKHQVTICVYKTQNVSPLFQQLHLTQRPHFNKAFH